jgi:hypothetical protein
MSETAANSYYPLVYLPCPYAYWTLYCPFRSTDKCKTCPVKKEAERLREKGEGEP